MKTTTYRQCEMIRHTRVQVAWIPEKFAKVGAYVKLRDEDGWRITFVSTGTLTEEERRHAGDHDVFASIAG